MHVENITSNAMSLDRNGQSMLIQVYEKEIDRLNNIINELKKYINETKLKEFEKVYGKRYSKTFTQAEVIVCNMILDKLKELKEE